MLLRALFRHPLSLSTWAGVLSVLAIVLPPVVLGPWVPFIDLVSFVGMNSYPPQLSYGPTHYYVFQFTYIVHYALSRFLCDLNVTVPFQILLIYLLQAGILFTIIWRTLRQLLPDGWFCAAAIAFGALAYWDGLFIWGGPLAFSLAACAVAFATFLTLRQVERPDLPGQYLPVALLTLLGGMCHPFALVFALVLAGLRWLFLPSRRWQSASLIAAILLFGWVIRNDAPLGESGAAARLPSLFSFYGAEASERLVELFTDAAAINYLFDITPIGLTCYFIALGAIRLIGFLASPFVVFFAKKSRALRLLALLDLVVAVLYFCSVRNDGVIPQWPQRILTFNSPFTYLAGIVGPVFLLRHFDWWKIDHPAKPARAILCAIPAAVALCMAVVQIPILRLGETLHRNYIAVRKAILDTSVTNAVLIVAGVDSIKPFYLRSVPFLLFSDDLLLKRNLLVYTEWHTQARHPTRLTEEMFDLGRPRFLVRFPLTGGLLSATLTRQPSGIFPVPEGTNVAGIGNKLNLANTQYIKGTELLVAGYLRDATAHLATAVNLWPDYAEAHLNLGAALYRSERIPEAIEQFRAAVRIQPNYAEAHFNLSTVLFAAGARAEALEHLQTALRLKPDYPDARETLRLIMDQK